MDYDEKHKEYIEQYYSDIVESSKFIKEDKSVKTIKQAWNRLKQAVDEFAEKNNLAFEVHEFTADKEEGIFGQSVQDEDEINVCQAGERRFYITRPNFQKDFCIFESSLADKSFCESYDFKEYNCILFVLYWYFKIPTEKNIELLHKTREQMELDYLKNKKIEEVNSATLNTCLDALCKENNLKYTIDEDNTSCIITFRLRPYYRLQVKLLYSEFSTQLAELKDVLQKAMEISDSSLNPIISCNWEY